MIARTIQRYTLTVAGLFLSLAVSPHAAAGQSPTTVTPEATLVAVDDAPETVKSSHDIGAFTSGNLERSARLHETTARGLRPWKHADRAEHFWMAAHLFSAAGEDRNAMRNFQEAAEAALDAGEPYRAATAYVRAAYSAVEAHRQDRARVYLRQSREIAELSELTPQERETLELEVEEDERPYTVY